MVVLNYFNVQQAVFGMWFQQTLYNIEDTVTDFQHEAHKSAILCPPRHMKENLWASGFYVAIKQNIFNLVRACTCSCLCASALSLSVLLFSFLVKAINSFVFLQISSVQTFVTFHVSSPPCKTKWQHPGDWKGWITSFCEWRHLCQFALLRCSWRMTLTGLFLSFSPFLSHHSGVPHIFVRPCFPNSTGVLNSS